ncbi:hypothetical protein CLCR_05247 [Cladophialophora carrionii]|uniref:Uncharacterized protein n=1 Tax=Cladophialophora carrionii TaxID=86049 RepID=A0A1C1CKP1_9EURO|nr:hypothetical protein CLCR_05247 [Cladophialophora carrionii]
MATVASQIVSSLTGSSPEVYDLVVVGSGFAGSMTTLNFLEECKKLGKRGRVALIEAGKEGERCGASRYISSPSMRIWAEPFQMDDGVSATGQRSVSSDVGVTYDAESPRQQLRFRLEA